MKRIGIVSCDKWINKIEEDKNLLEELKKLNVEVDIISWEDKKINYEKYDALILKSVWGYQNKYVDFKNWLLYIKSKNINVFNSVDIILNNVKKDIQFEILDKYNIPHIKTIFQKRKIDYKYIKNGMVIKPIISGSGENTFLISKDIDIQKTFQNIMLEEDNGIMIQPFIGGVYNGEYACVYINHKNTHNMLRFPGIFYDKKRPYYLSDIPSDILDLSRRISNIPEYRECLYMRIDIVVDNDIAKVMEVELAEPDLLTKYIEDEYIKRNSICELAKELKRRIK